MAGKVELRMVLLGVRAARVSRSSYDGSDRFEKYAFKALAIEGVFGCQCGPPIAIDVVLFLFTWACSMGTYPANSST